MKSLNYLTTIAIAASLVVGVTGCKKTPKNVTNIPRANMRPIEDDRMNPTLPPGVPRSNPLVNDGGTGATNLDPTSKPLTPEEIARLAGEGTRHDPSQFNEDKATLAAETVYFE